MAAQIQMTKACVRHMINGDLKVSPIGNGRYILHDLQFQFTVSPSEVRLEAVTDKGETVATMQLEIQSFNPLSKEFKLSGCGLEISLD
jgi:hypothetical protein